MAINKIIVDGVTKIDLTQDTVTADKVLEGMTFHDATGTLCTGTMEEVNLTQDTVTADKVLEGYTFHDATGTLRTGTMKAGADLSKLNVKYAYSGYDCENASNSPDWVGVYDSNSNTMSLDDYKILKISSNNITISSEERPYVSGSDTVYVISTKQIDHVDVVFPEACGS